MNMVGILPAGRYLVPPVPVRRFTVDEYHWMIRAGLFATDERFELINGWITPKMVRNPPHDSFLTQVGQILNAHMPRGWHLRTQTAVTLSASEPEPDLAIVPGAPSRYRASHPVPGEIELVIEVADSSLSFDRDVKGPVYATDGLPVYWIVNLVDMRVEVYTDPTGPAAQPRYRQCRHAGLTDAVDLVLAGQTIAAIPVADLLA
jgi:Uma2 family endonuclease